MQKLNYLELAEQGGLVIDTGVVDIDEMDTMPVGESGKGFVRVFVPQGKKRSAASGQRQLLLLSHAYGVLETLSVQDKTRHSLYGKCFALEKHKSHFGYFFSYDPDAQHIERIEAVEKNLARTEDLFRWLNDHVKSTDVLVQLCASESDLVDLTKGLQTRLAGALGELTGHPSSARHGNPASAASRRRALAKDWLTAAEVNKILGSVAANVRQKPARLRREGRLLGVWVEAENRYRYPDFQFSEEGLMEEVADLLSHLPDDNGSGWGRVQWLYTPHALLEKRKPVDVFRGDPDAVVQAARRQHEKGRDASW